MMTGCYDSRQSSGTEASGIMDGKIRHWEIVDRVPGDRGSGDCKDNMNQELIIVLDFGGQYNQLIARRVRECGVYAEVHPYTLSPEKIREMDPKGIIFTGGPNSVYDMESPHYPKAICSMGIPILGICYGAQLMAWMEGGQVETAPVSEYGHTELTLDEPGDLLFKGVTPGTVVWMSHTDYIAKVPEGFRITAHTKDCQEAEGG